MVPRRPLFVQLKTRSKQYATSHPIPYAALTHLMRLSWILPISLDFLEELQPC